MRTKHALVPLLVASAIVAVLAVGPSPAPVLAGAPPDAPSSVETWFYGRAELSAGVPCVGCTVAFLGAPIATVTDDRGRWDAEVPAGLWEVQFTHPTLGSTRRTCGGASSHAARVENVSTHHYSECSAVIARPGAIAGRLTLPNTSDYDIATIGIPALGIYTQANCGGGYLLEGAAPGWNRVIASTATSSKEFWVYVQPGLVSRMNLSVPANAPILTQ